MTYEKGVRVFWLKLMYSLTMVIAGGLGIAILAAPSTIQWVFGAECPRMLSSLIGSIFLGFGLVSILGLKWPVRFMPLLLMQLIYKSVWLCFIIFPLLFSGKLASDLIPVVVVFMLVVIGDFIAISFNRLLAHR